MEIPCYAGLKLFSVYGTRDDRKTINRKSLKISK